MLTRRQAELLGFIREYAARDGITPTFREMRDRLGVVSTSGVHRLVHALIERGMVRRTQGTARSLEVTERGLGALSPLPETGPVALPEWRRRPDLAPLTEDALSQLRCVRNALEYERTKWGLSEALGKLYRDVSATIRRVEPVLQAARGAGS